MAKQPSLSFHATELHEFSLLQEYLPDLVGAGLVLPPRRPREERTITRERDVSYQIRPHFHAYVAELARRLAVGGLAELQAADTDYSPGTQSLPGSVRVVYGVPAVVTALPGADLQLVAATTVDVAGVPLDLAAEFTVEVGSAAALAADSVGTVVLSPGLTTTPGRGEPLVLAGTTGGRLVGNALVHPEAALSVQLPGGAAATLPAGTSLRLTSGSQVSLAAGLTVTVDRSVRRPRLYQALFDAQRYQPSGLVEEPWPVADLDFTEQGAYSSYNWELFFHAPFLIATHLSKNQQYAEAQRWFHLLFDPTDDSAEEAPRRFWKVRPFQDAIVTPISDLLTNLATEADPELKRSTLLSLANWQANPFRPHRVARFRVQSYMYATVMAYLDNLIAWGDALFRQDTGETVDEAAMIYVLAANILGPRPQAVPPKGSVLPRTYRELKDAGIGPLGTVLADVEANLGFDLLPPPVGSSPSPGLVTLRSLGQSLYFCVPPNDKLLGYWDTVADRLFKIRNSLNISGVFRRVALFDPPIDPGLLARAAAAGLDVGSIINGLNQPPPRVRFATLVSRAVELAQEVKSLGAATLSAVEKEDGEAMALLRSRHERSLLELTEQQRYGAWQEAVKAREGLLRSLQAAVERYVHLERQLGRSEEEALAAVPQLDDLDRDALARMRFSSTEPELPRRHVDLHLAGDLSGSEGKIVDEWEARELSQLAESRLITDTLKAIDLGGQALALIPDFGVDLQFWGLGGDSTIAGGEKLAKVAEFVKQVAQTEAERLNYQAGHTARIGGFARREMEWAQASNNAAHEVNGLLKQLRAAQIREAMAELELTSHRLQQAQAAEIDQFLNGEGRSQTGKRANKALYTWMKRQLKALYADTFQFAFEAAKKAERALALELGVDRVDYIKTGYLSGKEGLLAGEKLYLDLKRMEHAYLELHEREYELTRHVSLLQLDPLALVKLRRTGRCEFTVPESLFDLDTPGHYFRRIRSVAMTIPCQTGPYAMVACRLTLLWNQTRVSTRLPADEAYAKTGEEDSRFTENAVSVKAVVTSSAVNDAGMFETSLNDERYLPFENAGAESRWSLQLPVDPSRNDPSSIDYDAMSDVILHVRYTAREGGDRLRRAATASLVRGLATPEAGSTPGTVRLFSIRHEFPSEWARLKSAVAGADGRFPLSVTVLDEHYPFWTGRRPARVHALALLARPGAGAPAGLEVDGLQVGTTASLAADPAYGRLLVWSATAGPDGAGNDVRLVLAQRTGTLTLALSSKQLEDLWLAITWASPGG